MAEITLADYTGYIFLEIIKAREMADRHSRALAEVYAQDEVLKHFSVPRFKVPKLELTIPVLISGARFNQVVRFGMPQDRFVEYILGRINDVVSAVRNTDPFVKTPASPVAKRASRAVSRAPEALTKELRMLALDFWEALHSNPDPARSSDRVRKFWTRIFEVALKGEDLMDQYRKTNPNNELYRQSLDDVQKTVTNNTVVDSTTIQSLLINPETNVVKNGSSDTSVFTIKAEMLEEGFFIRQIKDEASGRTTKVVEFE